MFGFESFLSVFGLFLEFTGLARNNFPVTTLPGLLFPRESETREVKSLDGFWDFLAPPIEDVHRGHSQRWYAESLSKAGKVMQMPVPSSYNDITISSELRDHVGPVWYEKTFIVPASWTHKRVFLRFGSVNYFAQVWINGKFLMSHEIGHLPFEAEVTSCVAFGRRNRVTVSVDNVLLENSLPQGKIDEVVSDKGTVRTQTYPFDFFNYAGIHRPVLLHSKPKAYIDDVTVKTEITNGTGLIAYKVHVRGIGSDDSYSCDVSLIDDSNRYVIRDSLAGKEGILKLKLPKLWWPRWMSDDPGYMYTLEIVLRVRNTSESDVYRLPIGIRSIKWTENSLLINEKPIYFRGFGRHEDSAIRGRGLDLVTIARDHELLKWVGANAYRTSHYPYSDEVLDFADKLGFLVIGECPSVDADNYSPVVLKKHQDSLSELIRRDKNRPSVVMWSIANEPRTSVFGADVYFGQVARHTKGLDASRPITMAIATPSDEDIAGKYLDVISFNRYNAWYSNPGRLDMITKNVVSEAESWHEKYKKPVLMSEYGADSMPGLHELPEYVWSEEYQMKLMSMHFKAFDELKARGFFIGEFIWNFADFKTAQTYTRVGGNRKGIFTRDRQPKAVSHFVRKRYLSLTNRLDRTKSIDCIGKRILQ